MLSLFFPRSIRHFPNCRRKQTKTEILFSYLIIFEVNNRFVAFSIDKNFQKSTEIGSQFHNLPPACSSVSPASSLSFSLRPPLPACSPAVSLPPCPHASAVSVRCPSTASSFSRSVLPPPLNRRFLRFGLYIRRGLRPASPNFAFPAPAGRLPQPASSPRRPISPRRVLQPAPTRFFPLFLLATASPCLFPGCFSPAVSSCFRSFRPLPLNRVFLLPQRPAAASQPLLSSLRRPFRRSFSLSDKLFTIKKDVPKARLFLQAFFYSLHSSSAAKTSGLQPNTSCQIPRILRPHQTSVRINMRLPENIICR